MKAVVMIFALLLAVIPANAEDFVKRFNAAVNTGDDGQVDRALADWKAAEPQNPGPYIKAGNYYFNKARRELIQMSPKPPAKGEFALRDRESGKVVGSMGPFVSINPAIAARATENLSEATEKFPDRLDIWFGLTYLYKQLNRFDSLYATLEKALAYAAAHPAELKWKEGQPLGEEAMTFPPAHAQRYIAQYFSRGTQEGREKAFKLAKLVASFYPKHPYPINSIAVYYADKEDWVQAVSYYEKAHKLDPNDAIITLNLGMTYAKMNKKAKAQACFEKVIASDAGEAIRKKARKELDELK